eukprot:g1995.t1
MATTKSKILFVTVGTTKFEKLIKAVCEVDFLDLIHELKYDELRIQYGPEGKPPIFRTSEAAAASGTRSDRKEGSAPSSSSLPLRGTIRRNITWKGTKTLCVEYFPIKKSISKDLRDAALVVGHAGAGTILETLRVRTKLLVVTNEDLMDNHQSELAEAMEHGNYLAKSTLPTLIEAIQVVEKRNFMSYPAPDGSKFRWLIESELGLS